MAAEVFICRGTFLRQTWAVLKVTTSFVLYPYYKCGGYYILLTKRQKPAEKILPIGFCIDYIGFDTGEISTKRILLLAGLCLIVVVALFALTMQSRGEVKAVKQVVSYDHVLACAECQAAGQPARIWKSSAMNEVQCQATWGAKVAVIIEQAGAVRVDAPDWCEGWVAASMVKERG